MQHRLVNSGDHIPEMEPFSMVSWYEDKEKEETLLETALKGASQRTSQSICEDWDL